MAERQSQRFDRILRLVTGLPVLLLLLVVIGYGTAEKFHSQLLQTGESNWPGYRELRLDPEAPDCDPNNPLAEEEPAPGAAAESGGDDDLDDLFGEEEAGPSEEAIAAAQAACQARHDRYKELEATLQSGSLQTFRWFETSVAEFVVLGVEYVRDFLVLLILFAAFTATMRRSHIALRSARSAVSDRISQGSQLIANVALMTSFYGLYDVNQQANVTDHTASLPVYWMFGFGALALVNVIYMLRPLRNEVDGESLGKASLSVPLYAGMAIISSLYFWIAESHIAGTAIFLGLLTEHALLYVNVGLYVWTGMLLKQTRIAEYLFGILRPWKLPPELLGFVVVVAAALPTAYSGASGIFVIAAGAIIYNELRRAGARRAFAKAATAMSGSMGVVLSPCLLVVIVAALNKQVTTDQLFSWGIWVFVLNVGVFLVGCLLVRRGTFTIAPPREALSASGRAVLPLLPYLGLGAAVILFFRFGLQTAFDEHSAPTILPVVLLAILVFDRWHAKRNPLPMPVEADSEEPSAGPIPEAGYVRSLVDASAESSVHTGALLTLMGLSVCLGGIVERGELMSLIPQAFDSTGMAMLTLVFILVIIGMLMDPYGAVILVSSSVAGIAYASGIDPTHFWLVVLSAFELGYLTPPVALNHLLTRQVVGENEESDQVDPSAAFFWRHERVLFPIAVKSVVLLAVAFVPLWW